jgi:type III restriction enzyme
MDENILARDEIHNVNVLTVIANESYDSFAKGLQSEIAEAVADRPRKVEAKLFAEKFGEDTATAIHESLIENGYVKRGELTEKYYEDKKNGILEIPDEVADRVAEVIAVLDSVYDPNANKPENARKNNVEVTLDRSKLDSKAFRELWSRINGRSYYIVGFDEDELVGKVVAELNKRLRVSKIYFKVEKGEQAKTIESKEQLQAGEAFVRANILREEVAPYAAMKASNSVRYDLVGKIVAETGLTRKAVTAILVGIERAIFDQFGDNPEEFIIRSANIINEQKATAIIEHITYDKLTEVFSTDIFTEPDLKKGALGVNAMQANRHLYDYVIYDSANERDFASELESHSGEVEVYVKLPRGFYINTPVGKYNPDWAIAFHEGKVKHVYFVAETKGDMSSMELREIEKAKAHCAREHFRAISGENVKYDVVDSYDKLWELVQG